MKKALSVAMAATMAVSLAACGGSDSSSATASGSNGTASNAGSDKTLVIAVEANFEEKWNPLMAESAYDQMVVEQIFTAPQRVDANNEMADWAGSIETTENEDGTVTYTIKCKEGMTFTDGEPVTIDDYLYSLYVLSDPSYTGPAALITEDIQGIKEYYYDDPEYSTKVAAMEEEAAAKYAPDVISKEDFIAYLVESNLNGWWTGDPAGDTGAGTTWSEYIEAEGFGEQLAAIDATDADAMLNLLAEVEYTNYADGYDPYSYYLGKMEEEYVAGNLEDGVDVPEISGIKRVDDYTATVTYNSLNIYGDRAINSYYVPEHYYGELVKGDVASILANNEPMGSGNYIWGGFADNIVTLTANNDYFEGQPKTGTVKFQYVPDADLMASLAKGDIDICCPAGDQERLDELEANPDLAYQLVDNAGYGYMGMNCNNQPQGVRQGIFCLMNRGPAVKGYFGDVAKVIERPMTTTLGEYPQDATEYYGYNPEKALEYFESAGYTQQNGKLVDAQGNQLVVNVYVGGSGTQDHPACAMLNQAATAMAELGGELQIQDVNFNVLQSAMNDGTADAWCMAWGAVNSCDKSTQFKTGGGQNKYNVSDAELDTLLDEIVKTVDFDARKELVSQMLDRAMELAIELPLYQRENLWAYNAVNVNMDTVPEATASWDHTDCLWQIEMN